METVTKTGLPTIVRRVHSYEEAEKASLSYFHGNDLATEVFLTKYALRDTDGNLVELTPDDLHVRLALEFSRIDSEKYGLDQVVHYNLYLEALRHFQRIVAQGSPMAAVGNPYQLMSASNCVVVESPVDSMEGIMRTAEALAQLYKRRCGCGVDVSTLRPEGMKVRNAARTTSGAWSFCDLYSYITKVVCMSGRRGALMLTIDVHHPDVSKFITMKMDKTKVTGANVSVKYSDAFMNAVVNDEEYQQRWPVDADVPVFTRMVRARDVWNLAAKCATEAAEPGCIFWDTMCNFLPAHSYPKFKTVSTNPCSEIGLSPNDSCRLISLNLTGYVKRPFNSPEFDWDLFKSDVALATQMSDNLVDLELERIEAIMEVCDSEDEKALWKRLWQAGHDGRRVGLGSHGLGDTLAQLCIKYDSDAGLEFVDKLYETFRNTAYRASVNLAKERGPFPEWDWNVEKENPFIKRLPEDIREEIKAHGRRNIANLTQAPTGSISLCSKTGQVFKLHGTSSGVEPLYAISYNRKRRKNEAEEGDTIDEHGEAWQSYKVYHANVKNYLDLIGGDEDSLPDFFVEAEDIDWRFRVKLQSTEQKYIDHSISSTINLPRGTPVETVQQIYMDAWKNGLKGVTVYVDGSRDNILAKDETTVDTSVRPDNVVRMQAPKRPKELTCNIHHTSVKGKNYIALVGLINDEPYEFFGGFTEAVAVPKRFKKGKLIKKARGKYNLHIGKNGDSLIVDDITNTFCTPEMGWTTRIISTALRHGTPIDFLVEQLGKSGTVGAFNKVIARVLKKYIKNGQKVRTSVKCSSCGSDNVIYQEGCHLCTDCGGSKCC